MTALVVPGEQLVRRLDPDCLRLRRGEPRRALEPRLQHGRKRRAMPRRARRRPASGGWRSAGSRGRSRARARRTRPCPSAARHRRGPAGRTGRTRPAGRGSPRWPGPPRPCRGRARRDGRDARQAPRGRRSAARRGAVRERSRRAAASSRRSGAGRPTTPTTGMPRAVKIRVDWRPVMQSRPTTIAGGRSVAILPVARINPDRPRPRARSPLWCRRGRRCD